MVGREHILAEIRRTAEENGGKPLGRNRFAEYTGIRAGDVGRYWARWGDAVREAGLDPNQLQGRLDDDAVLYQLVAEIRRLGRMPTTAELRLRRRHDPSFPSYGVYEKLGSKRVLVGKVADYCREHPEFADVLEIATPLLVGGAVRKLLHTAADLHGTPAVLGLGGETRRFHQEG